MCLSMPLALQQDQDEIDEDKEGGGRVIRCLQDFVDQLKSDKCKEQVGGGGGVGGRNEGFRKPAIMFGGNLSTPPFLPP